MWEKRAKEIEEICGGHVDWEERFYECPNCGEPVYECDWSDSAMEKFICPVCEWEDEDEEEDKNEDFEVIITVAYTVSARNVEQAKTLASEMFMNNINCDNFDIDVVE